MIRAGRRLTYLGFTDFTDASGAAGEIVHRLTPGMPAGVCADASAPQDPLAVTAHGATLTLAPDTTITGRCAGPIDADLARLVPRTAVPAGTLTRPRIRLDLTGTRTFTVHGFSGELTSTITVTGRRLRAETQPRTPSGRTHRIRFVSESLSLVHGSGSMQTLIAGAHDAAVCALLDSCGAHGLITWAVTPTSVYGQLWASGPASLPLRAYRIALGLEPGRASRRIVVVGDVAWDDRGTVRESVTHAGVVCSDSTDGNRGFLQLVVWRDALHAVYAASTDGRSHCPGPRLEPFGSTRISGAIPLTRAGHQFSMHLAGTATETDDGYDLRQSGSLALTIKRGRITQRIETY